MLQLLTIALCFPHLSQVAFNARHAREGPCSKKGAWAQRDKLNQSLTVAHLWDTLYMTMTYKYQCLHRKNACKSVYISRRDYIYTTVYRYILDT